MLTTRKRTRPRRKTCLPSLEQLEDRRVFNAAWQAQLPFPTVVQTEVVVVIVTWNQVPTDSGVTAQNGLGHSVSAAAHEGVHGLELALFIHQFQGNGSPVSTGGDDGGGDGDSGGGDTGSPGPTSGGTDTPGVPGNNGGSGNGSSHGNGNGGSDQGSGNSSGQGTTVTPAPSSAGGSQALTATPADHADNGKGRPVTSAATTTPAANTQVVALGAALAAQSASAGGETVPVVPPGGRHEFVARADFHPDAVAAVLSSPSTYSAVRIDYLPGGTEQPVFMPRAQDPAGTTEAPLAPRPTAPLPGAPAPAPAAKATPATAGTQEKQAETGAEPQEAGVLTKVPMSAVPPLGLDRALRRLKDLLADLTTSRALLHALPITGALVVMGGAAFGLIRWRRKKRLAKKGVPEDAADDDEEKDTWLPGSGSLPPVDPA